MMNNQPMQALQSLISGGGMAASRPSMGAAASEAKTKGKRDWGFSDGLYRHMLGLDQDGQKEFLQKFNLWNDKAWWDGKTWVDPNYKTDPDGKPDKTDGDTSWLDDVQNVRDNSVAGLSDAMKQNIGFGKVTPGMTSSVGLPTSGYTRYVGDPVVSNPKPHPGRPDEGYGRPIPRSSGQQQAQAAQGSGMAEMLAKLIGG